MKPKGKSWFRPRLPLFFLFAITFFTPALGSSEETYKFERMWPSLHQPWYFVYPSSVTIDNQENVYVGGQVGFWKMTASGQIIFRLNIGFVADLTSDENGNVYLVLGSYEVPYTGGSKVVKLDPNGKQIAEWGNSGTVDEKLQNAVGIALDQNGYIYVVDEKIHCVKKYSSNGQYIMKWGEEGSGMGQFFHPHGITVDGEGNVWVADTKNNRLQKFSSEGVFLLSLDNEIYGVLSASLHDMV